MPSQSLTIESNVANNELQSFVQNSLETLMEKAPSDSFVRVSIKSALNGTEVVVNLFSSALTHFVTDVAISPFMAVEKALEQMRRKLRIWQVTKFDK